MSYFSGFVQRIPPVTKNLAGICIVVWLAMALVPQLDRAVTRWCAMYYFSSPGYMPFQLVTYLFLHGGFTHMFFNMFALVMFGSVIERALGSERFLVYFMACGIGAGLIQEAVSAVFVHKYMAMFPPQAADYIIDQGWTLMQQGRIYTDVTAATLNALVNTPLVGASGAIFGVLLAFGMLFPNQPIYMWFIPVPIKAKWFVAGYGLLELSLGLGGVADNVAHFAHLGGMLIGLVMILYWKKKGTFNGRWFF
ncbi:MAG: rhomboid family intramembrane serine protease [Muribaculaceae bacterium]|nr:rhomboid family intramembrane serine protease [Muribaculaceae bacterium]